MKKIFKSEWTPLILMIVIGFAYYFIGKNRFDLSDKIFQFLIGSGLVVWLIQKTLDSYFSKKFKAYENELQIKSDEHKLELQLKSDEHKLELDKSLKEYESNLNLIQNKHSLLNERRLNVLSKLYKKLAELNRKMFEMTRLVKFGTSGMDKDEAENKRIMDAGNAYNDFSEFFDKNKIYFSKEVCESISALEKEFWESFNDYTFQSKFNLPPSELTYKQAKEAAKKIDEDVPKILETIETEFRKLLGVL